jgi:hypothetical protein
MIQFERIFAKFSSKSLNWRLVSVVKYTLTAIDWIRKKIRYFDVTRKWTNVILRFFSNMCRSVPLQLLEFHMCRYRSIPVIGISEFGVTVPLPFLRAKNFWHH